MKKNFILIVILVINTLNLLQAQVKVASNTCVGIGVTNPLNKLDVYCNSVKFTRWDRPLYFTFYGGDPRIVSDSRIVFYNTSNNGFIDIQYRTAYSSSDSLLKKNFTRVEKSIEKLKTINGYTYNWKDGNDKKRHSGLLAQQVERVIPESVITADSTGEKSISYTDLFPYVIEAIKEQQSQIESQKEEINALKILVKDSNGKQKSAIFESVQTIDANNVLYDNVPNPFSEKTEIKYTIAVDVVKAMLNVYDLQGFQIKSYPIYTKGSGSVTINGSELKPGMYMYSLIVNGQEVDTKRMILTQ